MPSTQNPSSNVIKLRVPPETRDLISRAAALTGKSRSQFVRDSALRRALDVLGHDEEDVEDGREDDEEDRKPSAALRKLMTAKAPWDDPA